MEADYLPKGEAKVRLLTLGDLDGRTLAAKQARRIRRNIEQDLGGDLSEAERQLCQRAAVIGALCEDTESRLMLGEQISIEPYLASVNVLRRLLGTLGLKRRARDVTPSLRDYIVGKLSADDDEAPV
jgi:hypothetical protein